MLSAISKVYENLIFRLLIYECLNILSPYFQNTTAISEKVTVMVETRKCLDKKGTYGVLLTDLAKAFYCLLHKHLLPKFNANDFDESSLKSMKKKFFFSSFSNWTNILYGFL